MKTIILAAALAVAAGMAHAQPLGDTLTRDQLPPPRPANLFDGPSGGGVSSTGTSAGNVSGARAGTPLGNALATNRRSSRSGSSVAVTVHRNSDGSAYAISVGNATYNANTGRRID